MNKMHKEVLYLLASLLIFLISSSEAYADYATRTAILACAEESNRFIIRFGLVWNKDDISKAELTPTAAEIEDTWGAMRIATNGNCSFSNGHNISISTKVSQAYAYGAGGADPDAFFTLKIDEKPIYYKRPFYKGYGIGSYLINAITYDNASLMEDVSPRLLNDQALLAEETKAAIQDRKREQLEKNLSPFCKEMRPILSQKAAYSKPERIPSGFLSRIEIDINNDENMDEIYRIGGSSSDCGVGCGTHYFDGSYLIAFVYGTKKIPDFLKMIRTQNYKIDIEPSIKELKQWNALFISPNLSEKSARYIYNIPITHAGKNYISTFNVAEDAIPRRSLNELTSDNKLITRCKYP